MINKTLNLYKFRVKIYTQNHRILEKNGFVSISEENEK